MADDGHEGAPYPRDCPGSSTSAERDTSEQIETLPRPLSIVLNPLREQRTIPIFDLGLVCRAYLVRL